MAATRTKPADRAAGPKAGRKPPAASAPRGPGQPSSSMVTPRLAVDDAAKAADWYRRAFGATELARQAGPGGKVLHATLKVGASWLYLSDTFPDADADHPVSLGGTSCVLHLETPDLGRLWDRAVAAGATVTTPLALHPGGDHRGRLRDPFGHVWALSWSSATGGRGKRPQANTKAAPAPA